MTTASRATTFISFVEAPLGDEPARELGVRIKPIEHRAALGPVKTTQAE